MEETWTGSFREGEVKMEKKTMGSFLAALRKANGMTQKELAERLNVSDKAVSRWERDECAPDLSLIPVLGEIFGVTADELIRGERRKTEPEHTGGHSVRLEKEISRILAVSRTRFQNRILIVIGLGLAGLIAAMFCNFGFYRAYIGFFAATVFFVTAGVSLGIFSRLGLAEVDGEDLETERVNAYRTFLLRTMGRCLTALALMFAFCLPLVILPWDAYCGILMYEWLLMGLECCAVTVVLCIPVSWAVKIIWIKDGIWFLSEEERPLFLKRIRLKLKCFLTGMILVCLIIVLPCLHYSEVQVGDNPVYHELYWDAPAFTGLLVWVCVAIAAVVGLFLFYWKKSRK